MGKEGLFKELLPIKFPSIQAKVIASERSVRRLDNIIYLTWTQSLNMNIIGENGDLGRSTSYTNTQLKVLLVYSNTPYLYGVLICTMLDETVVKLHF